MPIFGSFLTSQGWFLWGVLLSLMLLKARSACSPWEAPGWEDLLSTAMRQDLPFPMAVLCCSVTNVGNMVKNNLLENKSANKTSRGVWTVPGSYLFWELEWWAIVIYNSSYKVTFFINCSFTLWAVFLVGKFTLGMWCFESFNFFPHFRVKSTSPSALPSRDKGNCDQCQCSW